MRLVCARDNEDLTYNSIRFDISVRTLKWLLDIFDRK